MTSSQPKYLRIYEEILDQIQNQSFLPGDLLPTESDLCRKYGVSRPTISRAFKRLSDEKLVQRRAGFGTKVLAPPKSSLLAGLLVPQLSQTEIFQPICASIADAAGIEGMRILNPTDLSYADDPKKLAESLTDQLIEAKVQGVFFAPTEHIDDPSTFNLKIITRLTDEGIHVVLLDRDIYRWPRQTSFEMIGIDNVEAGYIVATHLLDQGCKRLAFVTRGNPAATVYLRRMGCREALTQGGLDPAGLMSVNDLTEEPGKAAEQLLASGVDGVICANDATASTLLRSLLDAGAEIPKKVKVCGFDDVQYASLLSVPLTSYQQPCQDIGRAAADVMIRRIRFPKTPVLRITLKGKLIVRESSSIQAEDK